MQIKVKQIEPRYRYIAVAGQLLPCKPSEVTEINGAIPFEYLSFKKGEYIPVTIRMLCFNEAIDMSDFFKKYNKSEKVYIFCCAC